MVNMHLQIARSYLAFLFFDVKRDASQANFICIVVFISRC